MDKYIYDENNGLWYTTVNVQHIESLNDTVASITGILVRERIPDSTFDQADQVELVDIEPAELLERLASGNVYREDQAQRATVNFFTLENLTALREIALRRCADRVNLLTESARVQSRGDYHTDERILACLSSSPCRSTFNPRRTEYLSNTLSGRVRGRLLQTVREQACQVTAAHTAPSSPAGHGHNRTEQKGTAARFP